jgi:mannosyltransferase OCH1-like enzyme
VSQVSQILIQDAGNEVSPYIMQCLELIKSTFKQQSHVVYTKDSLRAFIEEQFDPIILRTYDKIKPYAYKADLGRYCLLYKYGGWYFDISVKLFSAIQPSEEIESIAFRDLYSTYTPWAISNAVLYSKKASPVYEKAIEILVENVKSNYYGVNALCPTGPSLLGRAFADCADKKNRIFGEFQHLTRGRQVNNAAFVMPDGKILAFNKPAKGGDLIELGLNGTNNYFEMYWNKDIYN